MRPFQRFLTEYSNGEKTCIRACLLEMLISSDVMLFDLEQLRVAIAASIFEVVGKHGSLEERRKAIQENSWCVMLFMDLISSPTLFLPFLIPTGPTHLTQFHAGAVRGMMQRIVDSSLEQFAPRMVQMLLCKAASLNPHAEQLGVRGCGDTAEAQVPENFTSQMDADTVSSKAPNQGSLPMSRGRPLTVPTLRSPTRRSLSCDGHVARKGRDVCGKRPAMPANPPSCTSSHDARPNPDQLAHTENSIPSEQKEQMENPEHAKLTEKTDIPEQTDRSDHPDHWEHAEQTDHPDLEEDTEKADNPELPESRDHPDYEHGKGSSTITGTSFTSTLL